MSDIFGIPKSSATQWYQDVASTQDFFFIIATSTACGTHPIVTSAQLIDYNIDATMEKKISDWIVKSQPLLLWNRLFGGNVGK